MDEGNGLNRLPVPVQVAARAAGIREGRLTPAVPRDAATVILLRAAGAVPPPSPQPAEVYMLRRLQTMAFAPGAYVFPGGSVDESDADGGHGWAGPEPAELGPALGLPPERAQALIRAAVRETFEESGVLLAGPAADSVVADTSGDDWTADRQALADQSLSLAGLLGRRGLVLRADLLRPWARWITPEAEQRRYDTRFFTAALPAGQLAAGGTGEADQAAWLRPAAAIAAAEAGELVLLPPTAITLRELAAFPDVPAILAARRRIIPRRPTVIFAGGQAWLDIQGVLFKTKTENPMTIDGTGSRLATCVLAPNPSLMTLDGTNTWLIAAPGSSSALVVDPGPEDEGHLRRIIGQASAAGRRVAQILLTHGHSDHSAGARRLADLTGAPVRAADPAHRLGSEGLLDGDVVTAAGCELRVIGTPGHSADSLSLLLPEDGALLTGDTVLGRGTTVIAPGGSLADYLRTLDALKALADTAALRVLLPGHGPVILDPAGTLEYYIEHRGERLGQVRAALAAGDTTAAEIADRIYTDVGPALRGPAELSVQAQLDYLASLDLAGQRDRRAPAGGYRRPVISARACAAARRR